MGFCRHISLAGILFSKTALPCKRIHAYSGLDTGKLNFRIFQHILVDILLAISAKPQLPVKQASKHKGAAFCLAIATNGGQILHRVSIQKFYYFFHYKYLQAIVCFVMLLL